MKIVQKEEDNFSNSIRSFDWYQSYTGGVNFETEIYCIEPNHYITKPKWKTCEICSATIRERQ
ncbi:hypothetical protein ESY86_02660 [Subsaximicrobium wynnwilliamsii]|uniref:Uncharacterized protein n=1 Tax=Subsaximicrobium wynnwilliamsii TaxID=291179 RepID=A0A5C6ZLH7_9FLAO|nr:hypothetical protein [Subsaximicrobium wynnwilliamsii]TXD85526.1 hypothetical protein ESY87_00970 [Subsaximicrobium wynnwilliamsii]TXD90879.1 hypothetical protein ESY86_02660 [Subsaximicrobium wynnwilliamsii]TXE05386.1 hypothetical protein ESY88_00970 [Subsaximicrobium wynnwilliamsii]